uniref:Thiol:disulfide interchange protein n=1 Tax=Halydictyon mirabile TaxID=189652 RepID=A0A4D6WSJ4_9FLOR|nr:Thiol:disulfide interchange protein [Halydictyon mirabile]
MSYTPNFWYTYELLIYNLQQFCLSLLINNLSSIHINITIILFFAGVITSLNPCFLSAIPLSLSYINSYKLNSINKNLFIFGLFTSLFLLIFLGVLLKLILYLVNIPYLSYLLLVLIS